MAGMDFGMRKFLTLYDGEKHAVVLSPEFYKTGIEDVQKAGKYSPERLRVRATGRRRGGILQDVKETPTSARTIISSLRWSYAGSTTPCFSRTWI